MVAVAWIRFAAGRGGGLRLGLVGHRAGWTPFRLGFAGRGWVQDVVAHGLTTVIPQ